MYQLFTLLTLCQYQLYYSAVIIEQLFLLLSGNLKRIDYTYV